MTLTKVLRKCLTIFVGISFALLFSLPYFLFREKLQEYAALGYVGLFLSCAITNATVLIPTSSTLFVVSAALVLNPWLCILVGGLGTALGEQVPYLCGCFGGKTLDSSTEKKLQVQRWMNKNAMLTVFIFAFLPLPLFDVVGIAAGVMKMNWWKYSLAAVAGKITKFAISVMLVFWFVPWYVETLSDNSGKMMQQLLQLLGVRLPQVGG